MNLRTPLIASLAVVSALGGVAAAAIALPSGSSPEPAAVVAPSATSEVRTQTIRRTIHVARRERSEDSSRSSATPAAISTPAPARTATAFDDSGHHRSGDDDSGHRNRGRGADDDSGHHGGDDSGHGRGRGRGRGGDDD